jgi:uncharacterized membrane protein
MGDEVLVLLLVLFLIAVILTAIVLPIVSLIISSGTRKQLSELESRIDLLEKTLATQSIFPSAPRSEQEAPPEPVTLPILEPEPPPAVPALSAYQLESIIGRRWVGWVAVLLILFATAFFLKYAFDNRWIGEIGRVSTGMTFGIAMCLGGFRYQKRGWRIFAQILTAGGIILLYLSTYAAFAYYHLVSQTAAFLFIVILIAEAAAVSLVYNAPAIATMALIGGLLTPTLLHSDRNQYGSFFMYLFALDAGALALLKHWRGLSSIAYFGTQLLFWLWYIEQYNGELRGPVLVFQLAIFLLFLLAHLARELIRREEETLEDSLLLLVNPFTVFATVYYLFNPTHHDWMGPFAICMALVYAGAAKLLIVRALKSRQEILLMVAVAITFVTIAIPIQLYSNWITIAWAIEGAAILWAALEVRSARLRAHAFALFGLAFIKFLLWDTPYGYRPAFTPVFNGYFLSSLLMIGCFLSAVYLYHRAEERKLIDGRVTKLVLALVAAVAFWLLISIETHTFFVVRALAQTVPEDAEHERWLGQMALSVLWAGYAAALAALGFVRRIAAVRWAALVLFALTIIKAMLIDIAQLQQIYRIVVFFVLGILLLVVAWGYHRAFHSRESISRG